MKTFTDTILERLDDLIHTGRFEPLETDKVEIKSLHDGKDWAELHKSACALLNASGGIIIVGIKEDEKKRKYIFTGYKGEKSEEEKLKNLPLEFSDAEGNKLNLKEFFPKYEIRPFRNGNICIIYIEKLPDDQKFAYYKQYAYKRLLTGDHRLDNKEIELNEHYKAEMRYARELMPIPNAKLSDLDIDRVNDYITRLNREIKIESYKADVHAAKAFFQRKRFINHEDQPTLLGMLVCGNHLEDFVGGRCQVDGYVKSPIEVAENKQIIKDNILSLMERSIAFIYRNIHVGVSRLNSGTALPEYPQNLIEETVNNALAHRDYESDAFVMLEITPNERIEIRNPGAFLPEHLMRLESPRIRRIIPIAKAKNPKLADILKIYDRYEGRAKGMATLTNASLDNLIDIPYFIIRPNEISLYIPKGRVFDEQMSLIFDGFSDYILKKCQRLLAEEEKIVLSYFYKSELLNKEEKYTILLTPDNNHIGVIADLEEKGLIFRHENSSEYYQIYLVDRVLMQRDFTKELTAIFGDEIIPLKDDYRKALEVIYQFEKFALKSIQISANFVAHHIFVKNNGLISDVAQYEKYRSRIRGVFNRLEEKGYIVRKDGKTRNEGGKPDFRINDKYISRSLF